MSETTPSPDWRERALEEARQAGFDLNLIELNLALSHEERALRHASALALVQELRKAGAARRTSDCIQISDALIPAPQGDAGTGTQAG